jgi:hypothetical protein
MAPMRFTPRHAAIALGLATAAPTAFAQSQPRYLAQMQAELQAMGLGPQCAASSATVGACSIRARVPGPDGRTPNPTGRTFVVAMTYDDGSDTVYVYVERYAALAADAAAAPQIARRLHEFNWEVLGAKFEWSPTRGEIRLSSVLHTDSNFDRRAFRSIVRSLVRVADRYAGELSRLTGSPVGEAAPTPALTPSPAPTPSR